MACFSLKVRVEGYSYIGMGNSTSKKDAQTNAARDFVNYLVRTKEIHASEVPSLGVSTTVYMCKRSLYSKNVTECFVYRSVYLMEEMEDKKMVGLEIFRPVVHCLHIWL